MVSWVDCTAAAGTATKLANTKVMRRVTIENEMIFFRSTNVPQAL
jgi:hypothetical protein